MKQVARGTVTTLHSLEGRRRALYGDSKESMRNDMQPATLSALKVQEMASAGEITPREAVVVLSLKRNGFELSEDYPIGVRADSACDISAGLKRSMPVAYQASGSERVRAMPLALFFAVLLCVLLVLRVLR